MVQTMRASEGSVVLFFGSKLGIWKLATWRSEVRRYLWSGFEGC
jgi:hypothetical protein